MVIVLSALVAWWIYVPLHELGHAWGCQLAGGKVTRLEIDRIYGAAWLARVFPYVTAGSEYAGRLSGFSTGGSDLVYLSTCALPSVLTVFVGVPLLRAAPRARAWRAAVMLGVSTPIAFAPFVSLTGDYYEMGSILVSRVVASLVPGFPVARWRSDDVIRLGRDLAGQASAGDVAGVATSLIVGTALAFATYWAGVAVADAVMARQSPARRP